jgi:WD40 repeat protein
METLSREQRVNEAIAAFLAEADAGRTPERESFLSRYPDLADELTAFLADRDHFARAAALLTPASADGALGRVRYFGDYELLEEIARGGMGVVFKARQVSLNRTVALKMILAGQLAGAADVQRFLTEAEAAANLDHPNIVPIYEVGEHNGQHYFSMKLVDGGSLSQRVAELVKDPRAAVQLLVKVARAVHYAHQRQILHRDLKPGNVLLAVGESLRDSPSSASHGVTRLQPLVTDFGLAKKIAGDSRLTQSGAVVGTPAYMPPEQAAGKKGLTTAADVYGLGAILYELLTGQPPFRAETPLDTLLQVLEKEPQPPRLLNPKVDRDLETICLKCLRKEPEKRYGSAEALADDLERWLSGEPIKARSVGRAERVWRWCRRNPAVASLLAAVTFSLMVGGAVSTCFAVEASRRAREAENNARQARAAEELANDESERAGRNERAARQSRGEALRNLYLSQMGQAHLAWKDGQVARVVDLLAAQEPQRKGEHDFRGFEWYYLRQLCQAGQTILVRQQQPILAVASSRDGKIVASASGPVPSASPVLDPGESRHGQQELKLWDAATGKELRTLEAYTSSLFNTRSLAFSPDGRRVAAFGREGGIRVWETSSGKVIRTFPTKGVNPWGNPWGNGLAFSPDGHSLAAVNGKFLQVWDVQTGKEIAASFDPNTAHLTCLTFTPDGNRLVAGALAQGGLFPPPTVLVWDVKTGKRALAFKHPVGVLGVAVSPDGKMIASAGGDFLVRVWDVETKREKWTLRGHAHELSGVAFTPDGRWLLSGSVDGTIKVWDADNGGTLVRTLRGHTQGVTGLAIAPDGRRLVSAGLDGTIRVWEWDRDQDALALTGPLGPVACLAFHPDGRHLASGSAGVSLWDVPAGKVVRSYKEFLVNFNTTAVAFSPDGRRLATGSTVVKVWDTASGKKLFGKDPSLFGKEAKGNEDVGLVWGLAFSPDGKHVASCGNGVKIWDATTGKKTRSLSIGREHEMTISVAYSPNGKYLASGGMGRVVTLWDAASGEAVRTFPKFPDPVLKVSFSRDGRRLLAVSDSSARVWELASGQEAFHFRLTSTSTPTSRSTTGIGKASFSPDRQRLATAPGDGTVKVWDMTTGQQILSLLGPGTQVICLAFSPDGRWLAAAGLDGMKGILRIWYARPVEEKKEKKHPAAR